MNTSLLKAVRAYPLQAGIAVFLFAVIYKISQALYRLYFHPLSKFPGPYQAALSDAWLARLSCTGQQEQEFERLHEEYGTHALRIGPNELHLSDVSRYKILYSQSRPYPKEAYFYSGFNPLPNLFTETNFVAHKERRRLLNPFFSRSAIAKIEPVLQKHIEALRMKLERLSKQGQPIVAQNAFRCVTVDIISEFAFAKSRLLVENSDDRFETEFLKAFDAAADVLWDGIFNVFRRRIGGMLPRSLLTALDPEIRRLFTIVDEGAACLKAYQSSVPKNASPIIFDSMHHLPDDIVAAEAINILVAGSDTTAFTLIRGVWSISRHPSIEKKLIAALEEAFPERKGGFPTLSQLESISYLVACVKESLRVAIPVPGRLPRVVPGSPADPLVVDDKVVPPGSIVGMSAYTMHHSTELWGQDAGEFIPERWLGETGKGLDEHLVPFSKGTRSCIGQNLAQAELMFTFYMLYRSFDIEIDPVSAKGFTTKDTFTQSVQEPGVLLRMTCKN